MAMTKMRCSVCKAGIEPDAKHVLCVATGEIACLTCEGKLKAKLSQMEKVSEAVR